MESSARKKKHPAEWVERILAYVPIGAMLVGSVVLVLFGVYDTFVGSYRALVEGALTEKELLVAFISLADLFLLATVLYIMALGFYQLFIDDQLDLHAWLVVRDLDDLKEKLTSVVVVVLAVLFLGSVVKAADPKMVLWEGLGMGAMIAALSAFLYVFKRGGEGESERSGAE